MKRRTSAIMRQTNTKLSHISFSAQVPRELNDRTSIAELVRQADLIEPIGMV